MKKILLMLFILSTSAAFAQTDTTITTLNNSASLQDSSVNNQDTIVQNSPEEKMMFTQRLVWDEGGLLDLAKLNIKEDNDWRLDLRDKMITAHQYLGYATLAGLTSECIVGILLANGKNVGDLHEGLAGFTNIVYLSTASLALFSPPRVRGPETGWNKTKVHRILSMTHLTGMVATNILAGLSEHNRSVLKYHKAAAITTFASYLAATLVIKL